MAECRTGVEVSPASAAASSGRRLAGVTAWAGVCVLTAIAPFETTSPLVQVPGQTLTNLEAALLLLFGVSAVGFLVARAVPDWRTPLTSPLAVFVAVAALAALLAPGDGANALHMAGRLALALLLFVVTASSATDDRRIRWVMRAAVLGAFIVSVLAILEYVGVPVVLTNLERFRPAVALVGAEVRASGPLQYPTIASMYLEICFALGLGLLAGTARARPLRPTVTLIATLAVIGEAVVLTFTRAGLITIAISLVIVAAAQVRRRDRRRPLQSLGVVALVAAFEVLSSQPAEAMRARLTTEGQEGWFRANIEAPAALTLRTGSRTTLPVRITNTGRVTWDPGGTPPYRFSYHWVEPRTNRVVTWEGTRTELPGRVPPGASVVVPAEIAAPGRPGEFRLVWDIEQVQRLWFTTEPGAVPASTDVSVIGPVVTLATRPSSSPHPAFMPPPVVRPGRLLLWRAGLQMLAAHPIAGIGLDNFRLQYGSYAGLANADARVHSNNMYLELLVGTGLVGGVALMWLGVRAARVLRALFRASVPIEAAGIAAALVAIAVHGCVDTFLGFTPTYVLMAICLGLAVAAGRNADAHRI